MMSIDVFGRHLNGARNVITVRGPSGTGFRLTSDNQYDIGGKRLSNVAPPKYDQDAITLRYLQPIRVQIDEYNVLMQTLQSNVGILRKDLQTEHDFGLRSSNLLEELDSNLHKIEQTIQERLRDMENRLHEAEAYCDQLDERLAQFEQ